MRPGRKTTGRNRRQNCLLMAWRRVYSAQRGSGSRWPVSGLVLCARPLTWPREFTLTSLVARLSVSPFGKLLLHLSPALAAPLGSISLPSCGGRYDATHPEESTPAAVA